MELMEKKWSRGEQQVKMGVRLFLQPKEAMENLKEAGNFPEEK